MSRAEEKSKEVEVTEQPVEPPTGTLNGNNMKLTDAGAETAQRSQGKDASQEEAAQIDSVAEEVNKTFDAAQRRLNAASALQDRKKDGELLPPMASYTDTHDHVSITKDGVTTEQISQTFDTIPPKSAGGNGKPKRRLSS